jgi:hypothetical protein
MKCLLVYNPYSKSRRVTRHFEYIFKRLNKNMRLLILIVHMGHVL